MIRHVCTKASSSYSTKDMFHRMVSVSLNMEALGWLIMACTSNNKVRIRPIKGSVGNCGTSLMGIVFPANSFEFFKLTEVPKLDSLTEFTRSDNHSLIIFLQVYGFTANLRDMNL